MFEARNKKEDEDCKIKGIISTLYRNKNENLGYQKKV